MTIGSIIPFLAFGVALLWLPLSAHGFIYSAEAIEGWVVDAETEKPLEGVIVVAHWQLKGGFEGGNPVGELKILETVTDKDGRYSFPAWGPRFALMGHLRSESPEILMFKRGYKFRGLSNSWYSGRDTSKSDWNGKSVKLERFNGTPAEYAKHLERLNSELWYFGYDGGERCGWESFPKMLAAMDAQDAEFRQRGINYGSIVSQLQSNASRVKSAGCRSVSEVIKR